MDSDQVWFTVQAFAARPPYTTCWK